jgi:hypothetical protein
MHGMQRSLSYYNLLVLHGPVDLVVVACAQIDHDVLVAEEEHDGAGIVQLVHLVEVRHLGDVHQVDHTEVLHLPPIGAHVNLSRMNSMDHLRIEMVRNLERKQGIFPDLHKILPVFRIRIESGFNGSVSGSGKAKMTHKNREKNKKFHVLKSWMFSFEG